MRERYKLNGLRKGETSEIVGYSIEDSVTRRLIVMGLSPGKEVFYVRNAPLRDPIQIKVGSTDLILRRSEAEKVFIKKPYK